MKKTSTLEEQLYIWGIGFLVIGGFCTLLYMEYAYPVLSRYECVFRHFTGLYCPGCGGTRSVLALLQGHFLTSLWYHPLVIYGFVIYGGFMLSHTFAKLHLFGIKGWKFHGWYLYTALIILVFNWILKNVLQFCGVIALP